MLLHPLSYSPSIFIQPLRLCVLASMIRDSKNVAEDEPLKNADCDTEKFKRASVVPLVLLL
jgi:hypothetical protein